jgi:type IV pilus assembly protein PilC
MKFEYRAVNPYGEFKEGTIEAPSLEVALAQLQAEGYVVTKLSPKEGITFKLKGGVSLKDFAIYLRQFATLIEAKIPIDEAIRVLTKQTSNPTLKQVSYDIYNDVAGGLKLSQAFSKRPDIFPVYFTKMIEAAEISGNLSGSLAYLADYFDKQYFLVNKIRGVAIYPIIVLFSALVSLLVIFGFVMPQLQDLFKKADIEVPFITEFFFFISRVILNYWWAILIFIGGLIYIVYVYRKTDEGRYFFDSFLLKIPIFGSIFLKFYVSRFLEIFKNLLKSDIPVVNCLLISAEVVINSVYKNALIQVAQEVKKGSPIHSSLNKYSDIFTPMVIQFIAVGEQTGELVELLDKAGNFYSQELSRDFENLTETLQAVLLIVLGGVIGLLEASLLIPIYSLTKKIGTL